ncbi:MAG: WYL domain-containing transcriptional regulator [Chitinispirillaceae bacterium]|nr:WYL domain-containing transcriptional regulator [Chitinispirillaceae bacterium]
MAYGSLSRIAELSQLIERGRLESAEQAAGQFEVSTRTIERDIEAIRTMLGVDIVFDRQKGRYVFGDYRFPIPGIGLTDQEFGILLIAERALRVFTHTSFDDKIHPVFNKLLAPVKKHKEVMETIRDFCNSVHFFRPFEPLQDVRNEFSILLEAIMQKKRISMVYQGSRRTASSRREIEPYALINNGGEWYVLGYCRLTRQERTFTLSRISNPRIEDHHFIIPEKFDVKKYLEQGFGRMHGEEPETVVLEITPPASKWIERSKWHSSQTIEKIGNDGTIKLSLTCPVTDTLVRWVLQMGECVRIQGPEKLKKLVVGKARELIKKNR